MPVTPTYPGVYIQELPSSSDTITPAPTSIGCIVGLTHPLQTPASTVQAALANVLFSFRLPGAIRRLFQLSRASGRAPWCSSPAGGG